MANANYGEGELTAGESELTATRASWTVIICKSQTESPWVTVWVDGVEGDHGDAEVWVEWKATGDTPNWAEYDINPKWHPFGKIWVRAKGEDGHNVHMAITHRGDTKKVMDFDRSEKHEISKNDKNVDFKCR